MTNKNIFDLIKYSKDGILSNVIFKEVNTQVTLFCMAANTDIGDHTSTKEGYVQVIEGKGIFNLEGEEISMEPGRLIYMKKNAKHSLKAIQNTSFILILN